MHIIGYDNVTHSAEKNTIDLNQNIQSSTQLVYLSCFRMEGLAGADTQASSSQPLLGTGTLLNVVEQYALQG